jgi:hypothetical protein
MLLPDDIDEKSRLTIKEALQSKHPCARMPPPTMYPNEETPDLSNANVTHNKIEQVACNFSVSSGLGDVDSQAVSHWRLAQRVSC